MAINWRVVGRKSHRYGAAVVAVPFLLVLLTGIVLQVKKEFAWIQPPTAKGSGKAPGVSFDALLAAARSRPEAEISSWADVERVDVQPGKAVAKVQGTSRWEVQVDLGTGEVLQVAYRRSDLIETLHDGSYFHDRVKLWVFLPAAVGVLLLWVTGVYLYALPVAVRRARRKANEAGAKGKPASP